MKIAVTDTCIFIDLFQIQLVSSFFKLNIEVHSTHAVIRELETNQKEILEAFISIDKLLIHRLEEEDRIKIFETKYPNSLSETDKSVIHIAKKHNAILVSSDKVVRNYAKQNSIEYHGILWIFDKLLEMQIIPSILAVEKLNALTTNNFFYQNNNELMSEIQKRIDLWSK